MARSIKLTNCGLPCLKLQHSCQVRCVIWGNKSRPLNLKLITNNSPLHYSLPLQIHCQNPISESRWRHELLCKGEPCHVDVNDRFTSTSWAFLLYIKGWDSNFHDRVLLGLKPSAAQTKNVLVVICDMSDWRAEILLRRTDCGKKR